MDNLTALRPKSWQAQVFGPCVPEYAFLPCPAQCRPHGLDHDDFIFIFITAEHAESAESACGGFICR
jgi:hypothetical protein